MEYAVFTEDMKKDYTILVPTMLPIHFDMITNLMKNYGYNVKQLTNCDPEIKEYGLKYVHNDTCYPAQVVIGQLLYAIEHENYDKHKVALMITQTGGGCRASNYISLLRKALDKAGYGFIPVISLNASKLDEQSFKVTFPMLKRMLYAVLIGDLIMLLKNQTLPYETEKKTEDVVKMLLDEINPVLCSKKLKYKDVTDIYLKVIKAFNSIPKKKNENVTRVGIVGEIYVKFSALGNNDLEEFLYNNGCEVVMGGLFDFLMYCIYNSIADYKLYGIGKMKALGSNFVYQYLLKKQKDVIELIENNSSYEPPALFEDTKSLIRGYVGIGAKMGEGWLLTAEMLELVEKGVKNIICTQPFGCLPNHIVGKGMIKTIKEHNPDVNIVAIDYDAGASRVNQENRIKLMLNAGTISL